MSSSHTETLASLKRQLAEEHAAARALDAEVEAAKVELAAARDSLVRAYADQDTAAARNATSARDNAEDQASELAVRLPACVYGAPSKPSRHTRPSTPPS